jgi:hypothetical protein
MRAPMSEFFQSVFRPCCPFRTNEQARWSGVKVIPRGRARRPSADLRLGRRSPIRMVKSACLPERRVRSTVPIWFLFRMRSTRPNRPDSSFLVDIRQTILYKKANDNARFGKGDDGGCPCLGKQEGGRRASLGRISNPWQTRPFGKRRTWVPVRNLSSGLQTSRADRPLCFHR